MDTSHLRIGGAVCFWRLAKSTNLPKVKEGLTNLGLGEFTPEPKTPLSCLRAALDDAYSPPTKDERYVIRPIKNDVTGFAVVSERPKEHSDPGDDWGKVIATAGLTEDGRLSLEPNEIGRYEAIKAGMEGAAEWLTAASVGKGLVDLVEHFGGVALRPTGGVYWLNDYALDQWASVSDIFEGASAHKDGEGETTEPSKVYVLRVVADEQMVRAVGDALNIEVEAEIAKIEEELAIGDLKPHVCVRRMEQAGRIEAKVRRYERAFGEPMTKLTDAAKRAAEHAAMAALQASAAQVASVSV